MLNIIHSSSTNRLTRLWRFF